MKKILLLGATGNLGKVILSYFLIRDTKVKILVRSPEKLNIENHNLKIIKGEVMNKNDLSKALEEVDLVISALGHGFRTDYPILQNSLEILIPLMKKKKIYRFVTVTGAALKTNKDPNSFTLSFTNRIFNIIDPYRMNDARAQQKLLEESKLNWTVIRTPIHKKGKNTDLQSVGYKQPMLWNRVSRISIACFIYKCIDEEGWIRKSPIIY